VYRITQQIRTGPAAPAVDMWRVGRQQGLIAVQIGGEDEPIFRLSPAEATALGKALMAEGQLAMPAD
jgi:hypothetical protein